MIRKNLTFLIIILYSFIFFSFPASAQAISHREKVVNLIVAYKMVNFAGQWRKAIAVNNQIPGPTLHFKEGDHVTINVFNQLDKGTSIHWHGVLVPWQMDGVEKVNQRAIPPGCVFHYTFTLHQSGTYWYHAHVRLQEQEGLYGAIIIDPIKKPSYFYNKDYVMVLSDWNNTKADNILSNLKKDGDFFSPKFPLQPSLVKFIHDYTNSDCEERKKLIKDYATMQKMRMGIYDISDIAYDAFLLNGQTNCHPWLAPVRLGDIVRLRFIGAAASTIYRVKIYDTPMQMIHIQGNDVKPSLTNDFSIAPGETYDVLVKIKKNSPYIIYAESIDTLGAVYGALVTTSNQFINYPIVPHFPEPVPVTRMMMENMSKKSHHGKAMEHNKDMPTEATIVGDSICPINKTYPTITMGTKYSDLIAAVKTNDPNKPVDGVIRMELFGYMGRFIWFINGLPEYCAKPIVIEPNKRYRIIFTNHSMMRHPMHIHLHWFILRNGHGNYDPLLHTIEVPPGATMVADVDTDASGQAFFHCHHLYHMMTGMSRVFQYNSILQIVNGISQPENYVANTKYYNRPIVRQDAVIPIDSMLVKNPLSHPADFYLASFLDLGTDPFNNVQQLTFKGLYGPDYHKLELFINDAEISKGKIDNADIDIFYLHWISQFWSLKGGVNYFYQPTKKPYWQPGIGIEGLMPYFIDTDIRVYTYGGSIKLDSEFSRDNQMTNNFFIRLGIRGIFATKSVSRAEIGSGLNQTRYIIRPYYRLLPGLNIYAEYEHEQGYGVFKNYLKNSGDPAIENTLSFGIAFLF